jgi:hypothetical protein
MISQNVRMFQTSQKDFAFYLSDPELADLMDKHSGMVNVKVSKPVTPGTEEQNRAAHALLTAFYVSGFASIPENCTLAEFKVRKKLEYGPVYEFEHNGQTVRVPKSWADYSKQERTDFLEGLIAEVTQSGALAASDKLQEILKGMEDNAR